MTTRPGAPARPLALALALCLAAPAARADDPIDSAMYRIPELPVPKVVRTYSEKLLPLWLDALGRPEADLRTQAALAIARAHERGMTGLAAAAPALARELDRPDQHPFVLTAVARALVALDAKDAAPALFKLAATGDNDLREIIEPALARWNHGPAREEWLRRLSQPPYRRGAILAMQGLAATREEKAVPRLRELVLSPETPAAARLEAARALGTTRTTGGEADADRLAADKTEKGMVARLAAAWVLRQHRGDEAVRRLQALARDTEPSVAAVAVARLVEIDPALVEPVLDSVLSSLDAGVRSLGVEVLSRRPSEKHVGLLADRLSDPHPDVRSRTRQALREHAKAAELKPAVIREGVRVLAGTPWRGKEQAAVLLAQLDHKPATQRLVELLKDGRPEVAIAAAWGLRALAVPETFPPALDYLQQTTRRTTQPPWLDRQVTHLAQMLGERRYPPAEPVLRALIPAKAPAGFETRAAAAWAMGFFHEGDADPGLARTLAGRVAAVVPFDLEDERVRRMCAVALGRLKAKDQLPTLRKFYGGKPVLDPVSNACGWAIEQITGEKVPPPGVIEAPQINWFLTWGE